MLTRIYRSEPWMLSLTGVSLLCLVILAGVWVYAGSPLPQTQGTSAPDRFWIWVNWCVLAAIPLLTTILWFLRIKRSNTRPSE